VNEKQGWGAEGGVKERDKELLKMMLKKLMRLNFLIT
jgi:hypothetical protein